MLCSLVSDSTNVHRVQHARAKKSASDLKSFCPFLSTFVWHLFPTLALTSTHRWFGKTFASAWATSFQSMPAVMCRMANAFTSFPWTTPSKGSLEISLMLGKLRNILIIFPSAKAKLNAKRQNQSILFNHIECRLGF